MSGPDPRLSVAPAPGGLSVVVVVRNEAGRLPALLADLARGRERLRELVVVDGGSGDGSPALARLGGARLIASPPCRGGQLAAGVGATEGAWLLLLHGDSRLPEGWLTALERAMATQPQRAWAFRLAIDGRDWRLRLVERLVSLRCLWRSLPYGDQGLLVSRAMLRQAGGIAPLPLMEDLDLALRLRRLRRIGLLPLALRVSGSRWSRLGIVATAVANARLRRAWRRGEAPELLAQAYYAGQARSAADQGAYQKAQRRRSGSSSQP